MNRCTYKDKPIDICLNAVQPAAGEKSSLEEKNM